MSAAYKVYILIVDLGETPRIRTGIIEKSLSNDSYLIRLDDGTQDVYPAKRVFFSSIVAEYVRQGLVSIMS